MKKAAPFRHGRLLALCGLSAALHLLCLELVARGAAGETASVPGADAPLVLRLAPARASAAHEEPAANRVRAPAQTGTAAATPAGSGSAASSTAQRARPAAAPATAASAAPSTAPSGAKPAADPATASAAAAAAPLAAPLAALAASPAAAPSASASADAGGAPSIGNNDAQALVRYRVRMPPAVRLVYTLTRRDAAGREAPAQSQGQPAWIDWRSDGARYTLEMDGVLGRAGSSGVSSDDGILPQRYVERRDGGTSTAEFDASQHRIVFGDGSAAPLAPGIQDRASLLMQLAGIGLARPEQLQGDIAIAVAGAGIARVEHFQVMGQEAVETGAGLVDAWRLAQRSAAGEARLEVWLAPARGWLPVQLRVIGADGASVTQVLARRETPPSP